MAENEYRFYLSKKAQIECPNCGQRKFSPYIDATTGKPLMRDQCGRCSRELNCAYHMPPRTLFSEYPEYIPDDVLSGISETVEEIEEEDERETTFMKEEDLTSTLHHDKNNKLYQYLLELFPETLEKALNDYLVGFSENMVIFWQIDSSGRVRTGKKMKYHSNGKRDKKHLYLMHKSLYDDEFVLRECYFGEHLLIENPTKPVQIVESEKSALICAMQWPEFIWLSTGGKKKWLVDSWDNLQGHKITIVPDEDAVEEWAEMKDEMQMNNLDAELDEVCKGGEPQSDIADLILRKLEK